MKKVLLAIFFFLSFILVEIRICASSWRFEWEDTIVHIPVGDSIEKYKDIPCATLYKDNVLLSDADITYLRDGDWLCYLSNVNTSVVGEYEVWYKAFENDKYRPGTCPGYKCKVKFIVEDTEAPIIEVIQPHLKLRRNSEVNLLDNVYIHDNYFSELTITETNAIDYSMLGAYEVNVYAIDGANNRSQAQFTVEIYEDKGPNILYKNEGSPIYFPLNSVANASDYFTAYDEIDGDLTSRIQYPKIDTQSVQEFDYTVRVQNAVGLEASKTVRICIVDDQIPEIELTEENDIVFLDYSLDFTTYDFRKHIKNIVDNKPIDYKNLTITHDLKNEVGSYHIRYTYTDSTYITTKVLEVKLRSYQKPEFQIDDVRVKEGESLDLRDYVLVYDPSDANIGKTMEIIDTEVDYETPGTYYAEVYAINSSGLSNIERFKVIVEESVEPLSQNEKASTKMGNYLIYGGVFFLGVILGFVCLKVGRIKKNKNI